MTTLRSLRADVVSGYDLRGFASSTVASHGSNSSTLLYDPVRTEPQGEWDRVDTWLLFTNGTNNGLVRRVTGFSASGFTVTFAPAASATVGSGATYQLFKTFHPTVDGNLAINSALRDMAPERIVQSFATAAETDDSHTVSIPSAAVNANSEIFRIERSVGTTNSDWEYEELYEGTDYRIDLQATGGARVGTLVLADVGASGHVIRFHYRSPLAELSADTDSTDEPQGLIVLGARKYLALQEGDMAGVEKWGREFEAAKRDNTSRRPAKTIQYPRFGIDAAAQV